MSMRTMAVRRMEAHGADSASDGRLTAEESSLEATLGLEASQVKPSPPPITFTTTVELNQAQTYFINWPACYVLCRFTVGTACQTTLRCVACPILLAYSEMLVILCMGANAHIKNKNPHYIGLKTACVQPVKTFASAN